ncbi:hypothetical protein [Herbiconiux ginsengi]|uniref:Uncharacterized protein n=1 Tax=Herbiconiux ginsengi TaxID=381665 RepID=A0A1H3TGH4_9MICO|nr:hypothetical protein [Herbiconiux ginsengi]SDZ48429.1 hypothetical protein SAMN05216554_4125 [Herbiconiux ginsengi]
MSIEPPTIPLPQKVAAAVDFIQAQCIREEWMLPSDLPDQATTYRYVTDSCYLPERGTGYGKPGAGEFEDYGDEAAHAYLIVLAWERVEWELRTDPADEHAGELTQDEALEVEGQVQKRTRNLSCPSTGMSHRLGGTVLAPICLDCEVSN